MLSNTTQTILAAMLSLIPPGKSVYSRTYVNTCDADCQVKRICEAPSVLCDSPKFDQEAFEAKLDRSLKDGMSIEDWTKYEDQTKQQSWNYAETYEEGLKRYAVIAEAINQVAHQMSWSTGTDSCKEECGNTKTFYIQPSATCKKCVSDHPWMGTERELQAALTVVMYGESGYRQDVHAGLGTLGKGDCEWKDKLTHKKAQPFAKNAEPVAGTCKSFCLAQINLGSSEGVKFGFKAQDLVGVDLASTRRCASASARILSQARSMCSGRLSDYKGDWAQGMFSAYGTGGTCKAMVGTGGTLQEASWPGDRAKKFWTMMKHPVSLKEEPKKLLGLVAQTQVSASSEGNASGKVAATAP